MPAVDKKRRSVISRRYRDCPIDGPRYQDVEIGSLSDFFAVFHSLLESGKIYWFRGHPNLRYQLTPSALRYSSPTERETALSLVADLKRFLGMKLPRPPVWDDHLGWMQVAQHYGLPTRLLDWTQNAAVALFFACADEPDDDGLVAVLNPIELNQTINPKLPRILDNERDSQILAPYFELDGKINPRGKRTVALNPAWNNDRIALQQGFFTLHGSRKFELDRSQASSLLYVPILREHKASLLDELARVGIGEMFIFPEPEHVCKHLKRTNKL